MLVAVRRIFLQSAERPLKIARLQRALFPALLLARAVFDGATLRLGHRIVILLFVHSQRGLHAGFFVKDFPDRGGFVPAMLLIGQCLEGPVKDQRKSDGNGGGFLVPHPADRVRANLAEQENSMLTVCMIQSYTLLHAQNEAAQRQRAGDVPAPPRHPTTPG